MIRFSIFVTPLTALLATLLLWPTAVATESLPPGDSLPRIVCSDGRAAFVYADSLSSPHGIALDQNGLVVVAEGDRVTRIESNGQKTTLLSGLASPEGVAFDGDNNLYVVEDVANGRLLQRTPTNQVTTLATGLDAPEGVTVGQDGRIFITESNLQLLPAEPTLSDLESRRAYVTAFAPTSPFTPTRLITVTPQINIDLINQTVNGRFLSLTDITQQADGTLYVTNELSGVELITTTQVSGIPFPVTVVFEETEGVFTLAADQPSAALPTPFATDLITAEGLRFGPGNQFPLVVVEEDSSGLDQLGNGRLSQVSAAGQTTPLCTGFGTVEDLVVAPDGTLYITEDSSGLIIRIPPLGAEKVYLPLVVTP